jgi:sister-chromatid-cohesion protein PDS5
MQNGLLRRLEQSHTDILDTFTTLIDVGSWNIVNHSSIPPLIATLQKKQTGPKGEIISTVARDFLHLIAKEGAPMFKSHVPELVLIMGDKKNTALSEAGLQALAAVSKWDKTAAPADE